MQRRAVEFAAREQREGGQDPELVGHGVDREQRPAVLAQRERVERVLGAGCAECDDAAAAQGLADDDRRGPLDAALWGMNEAVCGSRGKAHTIAQCIGYFRDAGFTGVSAEEFIPDVLHRVSGVKAG